MPIDFNSWHVGSGHVGGGAGIVGLMVLALVWRSIRFVMRIVMFLLVLALAAGVWVGYEYHLTGKLPF